MLFNLAFFDAGVSKRYFINASNWEMFWEIRKNKAIIKTFKSVLDRFLDCEWSNLVNMSGQMFCNLEETFCQNKSTWPFICDLLSY